MNVVSAGFLAPYYLLVGLKFHEADWTVTLDRLPAAIVIFVIFLRGKVESLERRCIPDVTKFLIEGLVHCMLILAQWMVLALTEDKNDG